MGLAYHKEEAPAVAMKRVLSEATADTLKSLASRGIPFEQKVHEARKSLKGVRALLRLVRGAVDKKTYRTEATTYRDIARRLSRARDAHVLPQTLTKLRKAMGESLSERDFKAAKTLLDRNAEQVAREVLTETDELKLVIRELREAATRIETIPIEEDGWAAFAEGLRRAYREGREARDVTRENPSDEAFHEWRKQVKNLRHQLRFLKESFEPELALVEKLLHRLSDLLGEDHDIGVLHAHLSAQRLGGKELYATMARRQAALRSEAEALGRRLYAETPKAFEKRLHAYWLAWRDS